MATTPNPSSNPIPTDATGLGGIPGMGSAAPDLLGELKSEVSTEAAPMLVWIGRHIKKIIAVFVLMVALILGYGVWQWHTESANRDAQIELGRILILPDPAAKLAGLEAYLNKAPSNLMQGVRLEIAKSAMELNNLEKAAQAYKDVRLNAPESAMGIISAMHESSIRLQLGKPAEALAVLEETKQFIPDFMKNQFDEQRAFALEQSGRTDEALAIYESLAQKDTSTGKDFYHFKINSLKAGTQK